MKRLRPATGVILSVAVFALIGGVFGPGVLAGDERVDAREKAFSSALSEIEANYVDKVDSDRLVYSAIRGMLGTLDPHSSFFDPREYAQMRERQEGRYFGLGITIQALNGDITAASVFEGSPAYRKGIRRGDVISMIDGQPTKGKGSDEARDKLRGAKGTTVHIEITRKGCANPIPLDVTRDEVYIPTVPAYFMIDATTGYIRHQDWGENTDHDIRHALQELQSKGMKRLLYDIRGNPGGPLDQAIKTANEFLPKGSEIVKTQGRIANSDQNYIATEESSFTNIPMVVLANRNSASASEIFTGAMQDHDRAYVVGETTFGKALVQSVYRISGGAGLALTTAHYYTPSGRLIQRPWDESFDEYLTYTSREQTENKTHKPSDLMHTEAGRPVYSGGGIEPDKYVADGGLEGTGFNPTPFGRSLYFGQFETYAEKYMAVGDNRIAQTPTGRVAVAPNFEVTDAMVADFKDMLKSERVKIDEDAFKKDDAYIRAMIRYRIDQAVFGFEQAQKRMIAVDPQAIVAMQEFGEAQRLLTLKASTSSRAAQ